MENSGGASICDLQFQEMIMKLGVDLAYKNGWFAGIGPDKLGYFHFHFHFSQSTEYVHAPVTTGAHSHADPLISIAASRDHRRSQGFCSGCTLFFARGALYSGRLSFLVASVLALPITP